LNPIFERLNEKHEEGENIDNQEVAFFRGQFKEKFSNWA
jgi:hypothetical protein